MSSETDGPAGLFSCVVDDHPRFHLDALRWFACLTEVAGVQPDDLVVHVVGGSTSPTFWTTWGTRGLGRRSSASTPRSPHCNKISGALRLAEENRTG